MEKIHLKTIDPFSQELLRDASRQGANLTWERLERLQPQDGFLRLGLSCPFGCMQGPCRIDPLERGAKQGVCGLGRDEMAAGMLLRLCLQGVMETAGSLPEADLSVPFRLEGELQKMAGVLGIVEGSDTPGLSDIFRSSIMLQGQAGDSGQMVYQALRLALLTLGLVEQACGSEKGDEAVFSAGYGCLARDSVKIGINGRISGLLLENLSEQAGRQQERKVELVSLGDWYRLADGYVPIACTSGESELLAESAGFQLLLAGPGTSPGLVRACERQRIPVVFSTDGTSTDDVISLALGCKARSERISTYSEAVPEVSGTVDESAQRFGASLVDDPGAFVVLIGGTDTVHMSLGQLPVQLASDLTEKGVKVGAWGDAAVWMSKNGLTGTDRTNPVFALNNFSGPLSALAGMKGSGQLERLQGICFTGLRQCRELALSLGLAALGNRVCLAAPLPIMGSAKVCEILSELLKRAGGELTFFDHPPEAREILDWLGKGGPQP